MAGLWGLRRSGRDLDDDRGVKMNSFFLFFFLQQVRRSRFVDSGKLIRLDVDERLYKYSCGL